MIKGIYAAASAMIAGLNRQTILTHNITNSETPGFKQILIGLEDWQETAVVPSKKGSALPPRVIPAYIPQAGATRLKWVGDLGLGVETSAGITDYEQGVFQDTGQPYDFAIQGNGFFHIDTPDGERYTRDGRFIRDSEGGLVTLAGYRVLDTAGQPITIPQGETVVMMDGTIFVEGEEITQIALASFDDPTVDIQRGTDNLYIAINDPTNEQTGSIKQGYLEASNVNIAQAMTQMISIGRAYEAAQQMVKIQDDLLGRAIMSLGKF